MIRKGRLFSVTDGGIAECLELATGRLVWDGRLSGPGKRSTVWSSPVLAGDRIYVTNQSGESFVLRAGPRLEVLRVNSIGDETVNASLAVSRGQIFIRTFRGLWCVGAEDG